MRKVIFTLSIIIFTLSCGEYQKALTTDEISVKFNLGNTIFCLGKHVNTCTDDTCCSNELKCSTFTCPNTYELHVNASKLNCINGQCDAQMCCVQLAVVASKCSTMDISAVCGGAQYTGSLKSGGT